MNNCWFRISRMWWTINQKAVIFFYRKEGESHSILVAALISYSIHGQETAPGDSISSLHFSFVPFLAEAIKVLVATCYLLYHFTIHRMFCICCIHVLLSLDCALESIFSCFQGWIHLVISNWLCVCLYIWSLKHLSLLQLQISPTLFLWEYFLCDSLPFTVGLKFTTKHEKIFDHMQKCIRWTCWPLPV